MMKDSSLGDKKYLLLEFNLGGKMLLTPMADIAAVMRDVSHLVGVPGAKPWMLGCKKVDGEMVPVIDSEMFATGGQSRTLGNTSISILVVPTEEFGLIGFGVEHIGRLIQLSDLSEGGDVEVPVWLAPTLLCSGALSTTTYPIIDLTKLPLKGIKDVQA